MTNRQTAWVFLIVITSIIGVSASILSFLEVIILSILLGGIGAIIFRRFFSTKKDT